MRVYSSPVLANETLLRDLPEARGIDSEIRGEYRASVGPGFIPASAGWPELWVLDCASSEESGQSGSFNKRRFRAGVAGNSHGHRTDGTANSTPWSTSWRCEVPSC